MIGLIDEDNTLRIAGGDRNRAYSVRETLSLSEQHVNLSADSKRKLMRTQARVRTILKQLARHEANGSITQTSRALPFLVPLTTLIGASISIQPCRATASREDAYCDDRGVFRRGEMLVKNGSVKYEVLREYSDEHRVLRDIAISDEVCTREMLERLGRQLAKEFKGKLVVVVNIVRKGEARSTGSRGSGTGRQTTDASGHWRGKYVKIGEIGFHQILVFAGQPELVTEVIKYS